MKIASRTLFVAAVIALAAFWLLPIRETQEAVRLTMQVVVSLVPLVCCLIVILSDKSSENDKRWAYATAGTILGYWLNAPSKYAHYHALLDRRTKMCSTVVNAFEAKPMTLRRSAEPSGMRSVGGGITWREGSTTNQKMYDRSLRLL